MPEESVNDRQLASQTKVFDEHNRPLQELIKTERDYIDATGLLTPSNIQKVMDTYQHNAKKYAGKNYASEAEIKNFLEKVAAFSTAHASVIASFEAGNFEDGMQKVAQLQTDYFVISMLTDGLITKIPLEVNNSIKDEPGFNKRTLDSISSLPFQRIMRYQLLLKEAIKASSDPGTKADLDAALVISQTIVTDLNTAKKDFEHNFLMYSLVQSHLKRSNDGPESSFLRALSYEIKEQYENNGNVNISDAIKKANIAYLRSTAPTAEREASGENLKKYYTQVMEKIQSGELISTQNAGDPPFPANDKSSKKSSRASRILTSFSQQKDKQKTLLSTVSSKVIESSVTSVVKEVDKDNTDKKQKPGPSR